MAHNWAHTQQENASEIWGIITQRSRRNMPTQEMGTLNRVGHETLQGLGTYGEVIDWTNKQASIGKALESNPLTYNISKQLRQSKIGDDILNFSYHDARQGAVKWIGGKNQAAGVAANILLPDAVDFIGGVGYADNLVKAVNKYGPDLIGRLKNVPNAQAILKRGGEEANKLLDQATQGLDNILDPFGGAVRVGADGTNVATRGADKFTPSNVFQAKSLEKIAGSGPAPGALRLEGLRERVLSGASEADLEKYLDTDYAKALHKRYKDGRGLYYNPKSLSKNKELLNQIVEKHENIGRLHLNYKLSNTDVNQRKLYDEIGRNYFNNAALVYGNNKARDALVNVSHWLTKDHWHHIFGNKEVGEGLLSVIAQDPLVGVNIARHMHKLKLHSSGIAENIAIIKEFGHKQFHDFLRAAGFEGKFGRSAPLAINEHLQEVSKLATKGTTYTAKAGPGLAGQVVEADPSYVNEIFTLLDQYAEVNTFMKKLMKKGNVWFDPVSKKIVPKNTEGAIMFNFRAQRYGKDTPIEFLNERIGRVTDIYELYN
tara:strand:- start:305 stop:1933 length:1629 start_codon:yes stop_codon:yes gene_type:complete